MAKLNNPKALQLNGTNAYVDCGNSPTFHITTGTIEAVIQTTNAGTGYRGIVVKQQSFGLFLNDNVLTAYDWSTDLGRTTGITANNGQPRHVAMTFQSGVVNGTRLYLDGELVLTTTITVLSQTVPFVIGNGGVTGTQLFTGIIDEVRVWNRVLTGNEIKDIAFKSLVQTVDREGLIGYYRLDEGTGTRVFDSSDSALHGTLVGSGVWVDGIVDLPTDFPLNILTPNPQVYRNSGAPVGYEVRMPSGGLRFNTKAELPVVTVGQSGGYTEYYVEINRNEWERVRSIEIA